MALLAFFWLFYLKTNDNTEQPIQQNKDMKGCHFIECNPKKKFCVPQKKVLSFWPNRTVEVRPNQTFGRSLPPSPEIISPHCELGCSSVQDDPEQAKRRVKNDPAMHNPQFQLCKTIEFHRKKSFEFHCMQQDITPVFQEH